MDTLRGAFDSSDLIGDDTDWDAYEDDTSHDLPPAAIGQDERRMQVRAYNHWASLLGEGAFPSIEDLDPENIDDFGPFSVLLDFSAGIEDPAVQYLGAELASECGTDGGIEKLSDVPSRSLLSRITDHYLQILANEAPIGFEAEFVNQRGATIMYRGILLPFSSNDETIDFIYGVINWKEIADQRTADELLLEIDQALDADAPEETSDAEDEPHKHHSDELVAGPSADIFELGAENVIGEDAFAEDPEFDIGNSSVDDTEAESSNIASFGSNFGFGSGKNDLPTPDFGQYGLDDTDDENEEDGGDYGFASLSDFIKTPVKKAVDLDADRFDPGEYAAQYSDDEEVEDPASGGAYADAFDLSDYAEEEVEDDEEDFSASYMAEEDEPADEMERPVSFAATERPFAKKPISFDDNDAVSEELAEPLAFASDDFPFAEPKVESEPEEVDVAFDMVETSEAPETEDVSAAVEEPAVDENSIEPEPEASVDAKEAVETLEPAAVVPLAKADAAVSDLDENAGLYDFLASARELAASASTAEDRSRGALYAAVGRAYDFALAAQENKADYEDLLEDSGLTVQERAPMTPVVKLVFGADYDKTRLTEYAAVLSYAQRKAFARGTLSAFLSTYDGGLKAVVAAERRLRREEAGKPVETPEEIRAALAAKLRELEELAFDALEADGPEFSIVMVRRDGRGGVSMIGEIDDDKLVERAARKLVG